MKRDLYAEVSTRIVAELEAGAAALDQAMVGKPRRTPENRFGSRNYAAEELIAKLGAAFLCAELPLRVISGIRAISAPGLSF
jgi:antirestriction protein ArdC